MQQALEELEKALEHLDAAEAELSQEGQEMEIRSIGILVRQATGDIRFAARSLRQREKEE